MNLENFPTSEAGKRMMSYITGNEWYDKSYVAKWIFQVLGGQMDIIASWNDELLEQIFVESATWALRYHEEKYSLDIREDLDDEERRRIILAHRDTRQPITPYYMEQLVKKRYGITISVRDINNKQGDRFSHPNRFHIVFKESKPNFYQIMKMLMEIKQSHTIPEVRIDANMGTSKVGYAVLIKEFTELYTTECEETDPMANFLWLCDENNIPLDDEMDTLLFD